MDLDFSIAMSSANVLLEEHAMSFWSVTFFSEGGDEVDKRVLAVSVLDEHAAVDASQEHAVVALAGLSLLGLSHTDDAGCGVAAASASSVGGTRCMLNKKLSPVP